MFLFLELTIHQAWRIKNIKFKCVQKSLSPLWLLTLSNCVWFSALIDLNAIKLQSGFVRLPQHAPVVFLFPSYTQHLNEQMEIKKKEYF